VDVEAGLDDRRRSEHIRITSRNFQHLNSRLVLSLWPERRETGDRAHLLHASRPALSIGSTRLCIKLLTLRSTSLFKKRQDDHSSSYSPTNVLIRRLPRAASRSYHHIQRRPGEGHVSGFAGVGVALSASTSTLEARKLAQHLLPARRPSAALRLRVIPIPTPWDHARRVNRTRCVFAISTSTFPSRNSGPGPVLDSPAGPDEARDHLDTNGEIAVALGEGVASGCARCTVSHSHQHLLSRSGAAKARLRGPPTSVWPKPTQPQTSLSICVLRLSRSSITASIAVRDHRSRVNEKSFRAVETHS